MTSMITGILMITAITALAVFLGITESYDEMIKVIIGGIVTSPMSIALVIMAIKEQKGAIA